MTSIHCFVNGKRLPHLNAFCHRNTFAWALVRPFIEWGCPNASTPVWPSGLHGRQEPFACDRDRTFMGRVNHPIKRFGCPESFQKRVVGFKVVERNFATTTIFAQLGDDCDAACGENVPERLISEFLLEVFRLESFGMIRARTIQRPPIMRGSAPNRANAVGDSVDLLFGESGSFVIVHILILGASGWWPIQKCRHMLHCGIISYE